MNFSEECRLEAAPIMDAIMDHPFVRGIGAGELPHKALTFYVGQDFNYLNAFIKVYATALSKCEKRADMAIFAQQIDFVLNSEIHPHHIFCNVAGIPYETLQSEQQAPTTYLYNEHMYHAARTGELAEIVAAMLPCPWTYFELAKRLKTAGKAHPDNPFADWIDFYARENMEGEKIDAILFGLLDREVASVGPARRTKIKQLFLRSCELEWAFWDQAFLQKNWKFAENRQVSKEANVQ